MRSLALTALCILALLAPLPAAGQMSFGPQLSFGTDSDFGIGARLVFPLRTEALGLDGVIDGNYFFPGDEAGTNVDWLDGNVNVRMPIPLAEQFQTRIGAGLNVTQVTFDAGGESNSNTEVGLNLLGNLEFPRGAFTPFGEFRVILGGAEQVVLTGGFTLGGRD
ncbi:MAG: hypothetical protein WEB88_08125 [Gemmatimonadota bacterium]